MPAALGGNGEGRSGEGAKNGRRGLRLTLRVPFYDASFSCLQAAFLQALSIDDVDKIALLHRTLVSEVGHLFPELSL